MLFTTTITKPLLLLLLLLTTTTTTTTLIIIIIISDRRPDQVIAKKKKKQRTSRIVDHCEKLKENEKRDKYLDLARELKKLRNMKVTVMPIVIDALVTIPKALVKELEDLKIREQVETI